MGAYDTMNDMEPRKILTLCFNTLSKEHKDNLRKHKREKRLFLCGEYACHYVETINKVAYG